MHTAVAGSLILFTLCQKIILISSCNWSICHWSR